MGKIYPPNKIVMPAKHHFSVLLSIYYKESPGNLTECIRSIFTQTQLPTEVILVKDGPLGNDLDVVITTLREQYPLLKIVCLSQNQGLGVALNEGLKHCTYEYVARMDTDDIAKPDRFEKQLAVFQNNPDIDIVGAWIDEFEGDISNITSCRKLPESHEEIFNFTKSRCPINHPVVMFKKQAVIDAGGYQHFPLFEDYYLWIRMLVSGKRFYNVQESLLYFRSSKDVFKRRGGFKYALNEIRLQLKMKRMKFITWNRFLINVVIRVLVRLAPNSVRSFFYKKALR